MMNSFQLKFKIIHIEIISMSEIRKPKLPPKLPKKEPLDPSMCIIHKGPLEGDVYSCPKCSANMCKSCVKKRKEDEHKQFCPKCTAYLFSK